jgi:hypothetical protein
MQPPEVHARGENGKTFSHVRSSLTGTSKHDFIVFTAITCLHAESPLHANVGNYFPNITQVTGSLGTKVSA